MSCHTLHAYAPGWLFSAFPSLFTWKAITGNCDSLSGSIHEYFSLEDRSRAIFNRYFFACSRLPLSLTTPSISLYTLCLHYQDYTPYLRRVRHLSQLCIGYAQLYLSTDYILYLSSRRPVIKLKSPIFSCLNYSSLLSNRIHPTFASLARMVDFFSSEFHSRCYPIYKLTGALASSTLCIQ